MQVSRPCREPPLARSPPPGQTRAQARSMARRWPRASGHGLPPRLGRQIARGRVAARVRRRMATGLGDARACCAPRGGAKIGARAARPCPRPPHAQEADPRPKHPSARRRFAPRAQRVARRKPRGPCCGRPPSPRPGMARGPPRSRIIRPKGAVSRRRRRGRVPAAGPHRRPGTVRAPGSGSPGALAPALRPPGPGAGPRTSRDAAPPLRSANRCATSPPIPPRPSHGR